MRMRGRPRGGGGGMRIYTGSPEMQSKDALLSFPIYQLLLFDGRALKPRENLWVIFGRLMEALF